jgi:hypothetical protein
MTECLTLINRGDGTQYTLDEIKRMSDLLKQIGVAKRELAEIQHLYPTCSIYRVCELAERCVELALNEVIRWG